jgi:hypothetical protein
MKSVAAYKICGLNLESNILLHELPKTDGVSVDCVFQLASRRKPPPVTGPWYHRWRLSDGRIWLSLAREGTDYLLRFRNLADFIVCGDAKLVRCHPVPEVPLQTIRHLLFDQVMPIILSRRGRLVLHASAVASRMGGIAFLGRGGQGKSTLALSFCKEGFALLTDDCLLLREENEQFIGTPSYPGVRLWPDGISALFERKPAAHGVAHYNKKRRLGQDGAAPFCSEPVPLTHMYFLAQPRKTSGRGEPITIFRLSPQEAFMELTRVAYLLDIGDREMLRQSFERISRLAMRPLFYRLAYRHEYSLLPAVGKAVIRHSTSGSLVQQGF